MVCRVLIVGSLSVLTISPQDDEHLIKAVRGLDKSGPGENGQNLHHLWKSLTAAGAGHFHAAEESILRWLLKSMNGSTPAAETLRRYPLTWRLLACVFQRIPLFSLAKSLADRRFVTVLQQTLKEVSSPPVEPGSQGSPKRKRTPQASFSLEDLKSVTGCVEGIEAIFEALRCLLRWTEDSATLSSHDKIGAEHIKSLFGAPAAEAAAIIAPLLQMCHLILQFASEEDLDGCEGYVKLCSHIWNLHLQGDDDMHIVAERLFTPASLVWGDVGRLEQEQDSPPQNLLANCWHEDIQTFLHRTLIRPARSTFLSRESDAVLVAALRESEKHLAVSAPALYTLSATATESLVLQGVRKGNKEWMVAVFRAIDSSIAGRSDRGTIMMKILEQARKRSMPVDTGDLRSVCQRYALHSEETCWKLVANVSQCDPDVFQGVGTGEALLTDICSRSVSTHLTPEDYEAFSDVIAAMIRGFRTARELPAFLRLWFKQLSIIDKQKTKTRTPWMTVGQEDSSNGLSGSWIEHDLSTRQVVELLDWADVQGAKSKVLCLWLNAISRGISSDDYKDAACPKLTNLILKVSKSSSDITALKWRIIARALSWAPPERRAGIWDQIKDPLARIIRKGDINAPETFESFKCSARLWELLSPDADQLSDAAKLVEKFTKRIADELESQDMYDDDKLSQCLDSEHESLFSKETALQQYLAWYTRGATPLNRLYVEKNETLLPGVGKSGQEFKATPPGLVRLWGSLFDNEHCLDRAKLAEELLERAIHSLGESAKEEHWPGANGQLWIHLISRVPLDSITRQQREKIMTALIGSSSSGKSTKRSLEDWRLVLSLATNIMTRPAFFDGISFTQLAGIANSLSRSPVVSSADSETLEELASRYYQLASVTIKQMADHMDDRSMAYFEEASKFVARYRGEKLDSDQLVPLHPTLLKALLTEIAQSPGFRTRPDLAVLSSDAQGALGKLVTAVIREWVTDSKLMSNPNPYASLQLFAAVDSASLAGGLPDLQTLKSSAIQKTERRSIEAMRHGHLRGWKMQTFLQRYVPSALEVTQPVSFHSLNDAQSRPSQSLLSKYVEAITDPLSGEEKILYLRALVQEYNGGCHTDGQLMAIDFVVNQVISESSFFPLKHSRLTEIPIDSTDNPAAPMEFDLSTVHSEMTRALVESDAAQSSVHICRILYAILESKPQAISQWNVESVLSSIAGLMSQRSQKTAATFTSLCELVEVIIKKHRVRIEDHYHVLLVVLQSLLQNLILEQRERQPDDGLDQASMASAYGRLITLICEPTAGAVSRSHHSALDSAKDTAKRVAGRHMYLVLMQYVKLQLATQVSREVREALEPAVDSIFDITPSEGRKILNDAMDASGRAILRDMFKRYTKFGKWRGV